MTFAVLLGGATALLPMFARDILHVGAWGLGVVARGSGSRRPDDVSCADTMARIAGRG